MSKANRKAKYELYKGTDKLSDALKREFEPESLKETEKEREAKEKEIAEAKLKEDEPATNDVPCVTPDPDSPTGIKEGEN